MSALNTIDLNNFKKDCEVFFETGSCFGDGIDYALTFDFKKIISVEVEDKKIPLLVEKYKSIDKVKIIHDTSINAFAKELPNIKSNIIFWLDAHYPDLIYSNHADPTSDNYERIVRMPLEQELSFIKRQRIGFKDVIIFDDLNCFIDNGKRMPDWLKPKIHFEKDFYKKIFSNTHDFLQLEIGETIGILIPK